MSFVLFVSPILLGIGTNLFRRWRKLRKWIPHPTPTAWDFFFRQSHECWVRCYLKNGDKIGGLFSAGSFAGLHPHPRDLYIREVWTLTEKGRFVGRVAGTMGALVSMDECTFVEFSEVKSHEREEEGRTEA